MLILLSQCDFNIAKTSQVYEMNQREMKNYKKLYEEIGKILYGFHFFPSTKLTLRNLINF
jgi:hypothetical protein